MFKNLGAAVVSVTGQAKAAAEVAKNSASEFSTQALQSAATYLPGSENCSQCGKAVSAARNITGIGSLLVCVCCGDKFCKKCVRKSNEPVPDDLWSINVPKTPDCNGLVCKAKCYPECTNYWMALMTSKYEKITSEIVFQHLHNQLTHQIMFPKPTILLDSKTRKAKRLLYLAEYAAEVVGLDNYFKVIKIAAMGTGALSVVLQGDVAKVLYPLMECLKQFGIEGHPFSSASPLSLVGPNGLLRVYYLGCHHQLQRIVRFLSLCLSPSLSLSLSLSLASHKVLSSWI
jgi:hypothetical protein